MFRRIDRAQSGEDLQVILTEPDAVIGKMAGAAVVLVAPQYPVLPGYSNNALYDFKALYCFLIQRMGIPDEIQFRQPLLRSELFMGIDPDSGKIRQIFYEFGITGIGFIRVGP